MTDPLISIVSIFYNREAELERSIASLLAQTYANLEIIVVDDGSTDGTAAALKAFSDPRLDIRIQANQGFTRAIDAAVKSARGAFVAIHGSGDISLPDRIARQAAVLRDNPGVGVVGCHFKNDLGQQYRASSQASTATPRAFLEIGAIHPITHGEAMFRKSVFDKVGGYRPFFAYAQDRDLWLRMDRECRFWIVPDVLYVKRTPKDAISTDGLKLAFQAEYAAFADECAASWTPERGDLLDRYNDQALLIHKRSGSLLSRLYRLAFKEMICGDENRGRLMARAIVQQLPPLKRLMLRTMIAQSQRENWIWRVLFVGLGKRLIGRLNEKQHAEYWSA